MTNDPTTNAGPLLLTAEQFATTLASAAWRWNLSRFCEVLGWQDDEYAMEKFRDFSELARLLGRFDDKVLETILSSYLAETAARVREAKTLLAQRELGRLVDEP